MPLVYACICPQTLATPPETEPTPAVEALRSADALPSAEALRFSEALTRIAGELSSHRPETVLLISSPGPGLQAARGIGLLTASEVAGDFAQLGASETQFAFETDLELAELIQQEAAEANPRLEPLLRWDGGRNAALHCLREAMAETRLLPMTTCRLEPRFHFELGQAVGRALTRYERRVAVVCSADLAHALQAHQRTGRLFYEQYRRAITAWDVKWLVGLESSYRRDAAEDSVPQTAVLMGALSGYRIQPRLLSYESPFGVGRIVAAIDVLGPRRRADAGMERAESQA
jgi:aromatic ring-opening dioxygenase LigB subunit